MNKNCLRIKIAYVITICAQHSPITPKNTLTFQPVFWANLASATQNYNALFCLPWEEFTK